MGKGSYITLFSPSDVTAFYRIKYGGGGYITLFSPSDVTAFHRIAFWASQINLGLARGGPGTRLP